MKCLVCSSPIEDSVDLCLKCAPGFWENTRQAIEAMSIVREYPEVWPVIHVENHEKTMVKAALWFRMMICVHKWGTNTDKGQARLSMQWMTKFENI